MQEADTLYEVGEEERQACGSSGAAVAPAAAARWGVHAATSCIYESLPGHSCSAELRSSYAAYQAARSCWPLRPAVWRLLFQSQLAQLALGVLGGAAVLFNDQVGWRLAVLHAPAIPGAAGPLVQRRASLQPGCG